MIEWVMAFVLMSVAAGVIGFYALTVRRHRRLLEAERREPRG